MTLLPLCKPVSQRSQALWQLPQRAPAVHEHIADRVGSQAPRLRPVGWEQVGLARDQRLDNPHLRAVRGADLQSPGERQRACMLQGVIVAVYALPNRSGHRL